MRVLVTGGAGYIGSVVVEALVARGAERVVVLDDLSKGHAAAVQEPARLVVGDVGDRALVEQVCDEERIDAAVHMAAASLVGESMERPGHYYDQNVRRPLALLEALRARGVGRFVFSSTAATYGEPEGSPITEDFPNRPTNPYGETKLAFEKALAWYGRIHGLRHVSLRYFNAAGATATHGEDHEPESHLIPLVLAAARGEREALTIHGDDYPTTDGTCVRDYVHVWDLARAHVMALEQMAGGLASGVFNLGSGDGFSVRQVVSAAERITGKKVPVRVGPRRSGDPAVLVASSGRIGRELGWTPERPELERIIGDAWSWLQAHPRRWRG
jgi:UDP-glucose 4-epimerase